MYCVKKYEENRLRGNNIDIEKKNVSTTEYLHMHFSPRKPQVGAAIGG